MICELLVSWSSSSNSFKAYLTVRPLIKGEQDTGPPRESENQFSLKLTSAYGLLSSDTPKHSLSGTAYLAVV